MYVSLLSFLPWTRPRLGGLPHLSCKRDQNKIRIYMDRRVTSPTWGPPPPCKQALRSLSRGIPSSHLEKDERLILKHIWIYSWKRHALCYAVFGFATNRWLNTLYGIVWENKYGRFTTLNIPKCEHFTLLVCPLRFLVISAMRRLRNVQSFQSHVSLFELFSTHFETFTWQLVTPADRVTLPSRPGNPSRRVTPPIT